MHSFRPFALRQFAKQSIIKLIIERAGKRQNFVEKFVDITQNVGSVVSIYIKKVRFFSNEIRLIYIIEGSIIRCDFAETYFRLLH